jgi:hypothetical protein
MLKAPSGVTKFKCSLCHGMSECYFICRTFSQISGGYCTEATFFIDNCEWL